MTKCDFCTMSSPSGKCYWSMRSLREDDCEKAIKRMIKALGEEKVTEKKKEVLEKIKFQDWR